MRLKNFFLITFLVINKNVFAAEAGMPQLNPEYWASQTFWLLIFFVVLYMTASRFFIPKIKNSLDDREKKIKEDLDQAKKFKEESELKNKENLELIEKAKKDVLKIMVDSKKNLDKQINLKKLQIDQEIETEIKKTQIEINKLKKDSVEKINLISKNIAADLIKGITGEKLNDSSIEAVVKDISKNNLEKIL